MFKTWENVLKHDKNVHEISRTGDILRVTDEGVN